MTNYKTLFAYIAAFLLCLGVLAGCSDERPDDLIPLDTYLDLIVELEMANSLFSTGQDSVRVQQLIEGVFIHYDISPERFNRSHEWYDANIDDQLIRYRKALDRLNESTGDL